MLTTTSTDLEKFREKYPSIRVNVYDDYLVYKVAVGYGKRAAIDANELIESLGLQLVAMPSSLPAMDSFSVMSIDNSAL